MIEASNNDRADRQRRLEKIEAALVRARARAREIARQTGTALVYRKEGRLVHEYFTDEPTSDKKQNPS